MEKRAIIILLILAMLAAVLPVFSQDGAAPAVDEFETEETADEAEPLPYYDYDELVVGNPTHLEGNFYSDMWGNNTADLDVRMLIHGYNLVTWDKENGRFIFDDTVVNGAVVMDGDQGDRTYLISLYSDLMYSDGTPITAQDYVFTILLQIAPEIAELGGNPLRIEHIVGYDSYISGASAVLSGIRLLDDTQFQVTVRDDYLPFFYELGLLYCTPTPISVVAPGCQVVDNGDGVYIQGPFTADLLMDTILDPDSGYLSHPSVTSGPYMLTSWDGEQAEFEINPYYKGNSDGVVPTIQRIIYKTADNETMIDDLHNGEFGLLNKVTKADTITEGVQRSGSNYGMSNYARIGLTLISFSGERPAVSSQAVRQAIAYSLDKDTLVNDYVGPYGLRVEGFYGIGQWMYQLLNGTLANPLEEPENPTPEEQAEYEEALERWDALSLDDIPVYDVDPDEATALLVRDGWTLNRDGETFVSGTDDVRCKLIDGELVALDLTLAYPEGNQIAESFEVNFLPYLEAIGIHVELVPIDMQEILDHFYRRVDREYDMLYLGSNFDIVFDPSTHFIPGDNGQPVWNYSEMTDEDLYEFAVAMRQVEPGDILSYCENWLQFQIRFAEVLPMIPIYSNVYFDFYPLVLQNYEIGPEVAWTEAIIPAFLDDIPEPEEESVEGEELFDDGLIEFDD